MAYKVTVIPYDYSSSVPHYFTNNGVYLSDDLWPSDLTALQCACRILATWMGAVRMSREDWQQYKQLADVAFQEIAYYTALFVIFQEENVMFVPIPDLEVWETETRYTVDQSLLQTRFNQSLLCSSLSSSLRSESSDILAPLTTPTPDFAILHFNNYPPFKGFGESWFAGLFQRPGEVWAHYMVPEHQFPSEDILRGLKGIVLTGGRYAAYDTSQPWVETVKIVIKRCMEEYPHIRLVGVCLGAQLIAESLGGKVAPGSKHGRVYGLEKVIARKEMIEMFSHALPVYNLPENHSDEITLLPQDAVLLASSSSCEVEIFAIPRRVLALQSHPNYVNDFQKHFHAKRMLNRGILSTHSYQAVIQQYEEEENQSWEMVGLMEEFLKARI